MLTSTIQSVDISSQDRRDAFILAIGDAVPICEPGDNLHNERTAFELLDRMRKGSDVHEQQVEEPPEETQEGITEPHQRRPCDAVPGTLKELLPSLVQTFPNESIQLFAEMVSITRHNLRKKVKNMKHPGFKLEKKPRGRKPPLMTEDSKTIVDAYRREAMTTLEELQAIVARQHLEEEGSHEAVPVAAAGAKSTAVAADVGSTVHESEDAQQDENHLVRKILQ